MLLSGAWGKVIHEKNLKQKISWHCPFKCLQIRAQATLASGIDSLESIPRLHSMKNEDDFFLLKRIYSSLNYQRNKDEAKYLFLNYRRNEDEAKYLILNYRRNEDEAKYLILNYQRNEDKAKYLTPNYRRNEDEGKYLFLNYQRKEEEVKYSFLNYRRNEDEGKYSFLNYRWFAIATPYYPPISFYLATHLPTIHPSLNYPPIFLLSTHLPT
jgi:hypothetical protein